MAGRKGGGSRNTTDAFVGEEWKEMTKRRKVGGRKRTEEDRGARRG